MIALVYVDSLLCWIIIDVLADCLMRCEFYAHHCHNIDM